MTTPIQDLLALSARVARDLRGWSERPDGGWQDAAGATMPLPQFACGWSTSGGISHAVQLEEELVREGTTLERRLLPDGRCSVRVLDDTGAHAGSGETHGEALCLAALAWHAAREAVAGP